MAPPGTRPTAGAAEGLAGLLAEHRKACRNALRRTRASLSAAAVHDLRVAIRRLLSTLRLVAAAAPRAPGKKVRRKLRHLLRRLSGLRDTHVQLGLLRALGRRMPAPRDFREFLKCRRHRLERRLKPTLAAAALTPRRARRTEAALRAALADTLVRLETRRLRMDPARPATIHRLRVALKRYRYMAEALARLAPGADAGRLAALRECQRRMGGIQDLDVLLKRLEKSAPRAAAPAHWAAFAESLRRRRDAQGARLAAAWPRDLDPFTDSRQALLEPAPWKSVESPPP